MRAEREREWRLDANIAPVNLAYLKRPFIKHADTLGQLPLWHSSRPTENSKKLWSLLEGIRFVTIVFLPYILVHGSNCGPT